MVKSQYKKTLESPVFFTGIHRKNGTENAIVY